MLAPSEQDEQKKTARELSYFYVGDGWTGIKYSLNIKQYKDFFHKTPYSYSSSMHPGWWGWQHI
jgi:hypothetical protein